MTGLATLLQTGDTGSQFCKNWDNIKSQDENNIQKKKTLSPPVSVVAFTASHILQ
jgi:hypothetical protein